MEDIKTIIDSLYNLIAGAITVKFYPPLYNKREDEHIYSIQIDHLLVCEAGIFILETKNWSEQSIKNIDLRSPIQQIMRSSYALFVLLNGRSRHSINLKTHHWDSKQIPVKNIIVMTNAKPKEEFKHVKVLSLKDLNRYVTYFDPLFNSADIQSICDHLRMKMS